MTIYELNRNDLLSVLHDYVTAFEELESAIRGRTYAYNKVNHPFAKSYISLLLLILNLLSILWIPSSFIFGFVISGSIVYILSNNTTLLVVFGIFGALLIGVGYFFLRKKVINYINNKYDKVHGSTYGTKKDYEILQQCIDREKICQDKVNRMYTEYSMPKALSVPIPTRWIYDYLVSHNVSLNRAIDTYHDYMARETERAAQERVENYYKEQTQYAEESARNAEAARKEMERQTEILRQMNDRDYLRGI